MPVWRSPFDLSGQGQLGRLKCSGARIRSLRRTQRLSAIEQLENRHLLSVDLGLVKDIHTIPIADGSHPNGIVEINGVAFFAPETLADGRERWKSDGTENGTVRVKDIVPGASFPDQLTNVDGTLLFIGNDGLWQLCERTLPPQAPSPLEALPRPLDLGREMRYDVVPEIHYNATVPIGTVQCQRLPSDRQPWIV